MSTGPDESLIVQIAAMEPLLVLIEDVLAERRAEIETACTAQREWQERHNADCHRTGEPRWHYMIEFTRELTDRRLTPLRLATARANDAYDALAERVPPLLASVHAFLDSLADATVLLSPAALQALDELNRRLGRDAETH